MSSSLPVVLGSKLIRQAGRCKFVLTWVTAFGCLISFFLRAPNVRGLAKRAMSEPLKRMMLARLTQSDPECHMHESPSHVDRLQADSSYKPPQPDFAMEDSQDDMTGKKSPEQASSATAKGERLPATPPQTVARKKLAEKDKPQPDSQGDDGSIFYESDPEETLDAKKRPAGNQLKPAVLKRPASAKKLKRPAAAGLDDDTQHLDEQSRVADEQVEPEAGKCKRPAAGLDDTQHVDEQSPVVDEMAEPEASPVADGQVKPKKSARKCKRPAAAGLDDDQSLPSEAVADGQVEPKQGAKNLGSDEKPISADDKSKVWCPNADYSYKSTDGRWEARL